LEETYEAVDAIDRKERDALCEELGDVLLQVVFHAEIEREAGGFTMADVVDGICKKLIYRHPHVFGEVRVESSDEVLTNWETLKRREKGQNSTADAVDAVARTLPALWRAEKMQTKAAKAGFRWTGPGGAPDKLEEEVSELREAVSSGGPADAPHGIREEAGDVLFLAAEIAREGGVDPEDALHRSCDKFARRFRSVEEAAGGTPLDKLPAERLRSLWALSKEQEPS
jgi:MazG family protein